MLLVIKKKLSAKAKPETARVCRSFFKTGPGEYGEGDIFIGVKMPDLRLIAKDHLAISLIDLRVLLQSQVHEERMLGLVILTLKFSEAQKNKDQKQIEKFYDFYLRHLKFINNWDLVDISAPIIVGGYLFLQDRSVLTELAKSKLLWARRIAIVSTHYFIRQNDFQTTLILARILLNDRHDLIHKAVGWMLREVGKREDAVLLKFLNKNASEMPRVMLRYAIEKLSPDKRKQYLSM
jgi:3-methyladenine DNA glycosylase AlkD